MYVVHPVRSFSELGRAGIPYNPVGLAAAILLIWLAARLSWNLLEKPFLSDETLFRIHSAIVCFNPEINGRGPMSRVLFVQYTNPAGYPPLQA